MNEDYVYTIVNNEDKTTEDEAVMIINDFYDNSNFCGYSSAPVVIPAIEPVYEIIKEVKEDDKNTYHDISYAL